MKVLSSQERNARRLPRWKKCVFSLTTLLLAYGVVEFATTVALTLRFGHLPSMADISERSRDGPGTQPNSSQFLPGSMIHPYVGYVHTPRTIPRTTMAVETLLIGLDDEQGFVIQRAELSNKPQPPASDWGYLDVQSPLRRRSPEKIIVGILGGSVAENFSVEGTDKLAEELKKFDRFASKRIEFVRLAMQGFKQPQQLITVTYLLSLGAEFDVLVNLDGFNELFLSIAQNYERGVYPSFPWMWDLRVQSMGGTTDVLAMGRIAETRNRRNEWADFFIQFPWRSSSVAKGLWLFWGDRLAWQQMENWKRLKNAAKSRKSLATSGPYQKFEKDAAVYKHCVEIWQRSSLQLNQLCERHGIVYYHFLQPNQYVPNSKPMTEQERELAITAGSPFDRIVQFGYPLLVSAGGELNAQGVRFHSLIDVFRDHEESLYKDNCCHINQTGSEVLAGEVAHFMGQHP